MTYERQCQDKAGTWNAAPASRPFNHEPYPRRRHNKIDKPRDPNRLALLESLYFRHNRRALLRQSRVGRSPMQQRAALQRSPHTLPFPMFFLYRGPLSSYLSFQIFAHRKREVSRLKQGYVDGRGYAAHEGWSDGKQVPS